MPDVEGPAPRSWLYVPGDRERVLAGAADRGADALILDLEDAVAPDRKAEARRLVAAHLTAVDGPGPQRWVRVNPATLREDVAAVASSHLAGIVLAKAEADGLEALHRLLTDAEETLGAASASFGVVALIETAVGLAQVDDLAAAPRVRNLAFGEADLTAELGVDPDEQAAVVALRMPLVVASSARRLRPPTGPTSTALDDPDALRASTRRLLAQGFGARSAIHPAQVAVINEALTPTSDEVARARAQVAAFERAGGGAMAGDDGLLVDAATVRSARQVLARAQADSGS